MVFLAQVPWLLFFEQLQNRALPLLLEVTTSFQDGTAGPKPDLPRSGVHVGRKKRKEERRTRRRKRRRR